MSPDAVAYVAIGMMALVTLGIRSAGIWMAARKGRSRLVAACLGQAPAAIVIAMLAPAVLAHGLSGGVAALATIWVARQFLRPELLGPPRSGRLIQTS